MTKPTFTFIRSPNYKARRRPVWAPAGRPNPYIDAVVLHYTASMNLEGTVDWFRRPASQVSAHYVVGRDGRVVQMVEEEMSAWHAGRSAMYPHEKPPRETGVNDFSVGIELVGDADSGFTDRQLASLYELLAQLVSKHHIPPERVVGHQHIAPGRKIDPDGYNEQFPWAKARAVCEAAWHPVPPPSAGPVMGPAEQ
jgi:N-acetylmuramoyl-L-alanine amidase